MRFYTLATILPFAAQLAAANFALWGIPSYHYDHIGEVMSMTEFNATNCTTFVSQPSKHFTAWDGTAKHRSGGLEKHAHTSQEIAHSDIQYDSKVQDDESSEELQNSCLSSSGCPLCISTAASLVIGFIAGCAEAAYTAVPQGAVSYFLITSAFIQCASKPAAGFVAATGLCLKATTGN